MITLLSKNGIVKDTFIIVNYVVSIGHNDTRTSAYRSLSQFSGYRSKKHDQKLIYEDLSEVY